jgi:hypothetical protein
LLGGKGIGKNGEKKDEGFNVFFHNEKLGYKIREKTCIYVFIVIHKNHFKIMIYNCLIRNLFFLLIVKSKK